MKDHANYKVTRNSYQRAARFPIHTEIHFRPEGKEDWQMGETQNISRSGVLFNVGELLAVNTALEMMFPLPAEIGSEAGAMVLCRGRIVRTILPPTSDQLGSMAADFSEYRLQPASGEKTPEDA
jgi:PilZ domain-containing protein